jgi:hypothetical protein
MRAVERARNAARRWKHRPPVGHANVIPLHPDDGIHRSRAGTQISGPGHASPFDQLTHAIVLDQYRRGVLPENLIAALLVGVGVLA